MSAADKNPDFPAARGLFSHHERTFENFRFVYPVLSRRSEWDFDRREPEPRQGLQLRLHLLPG